MKHILEPNAKVFVAAPYLPSHGKTGVIEYRSYSYYVVKINESHLCTYVCSELRVIHET